MSHLPFQPRGTYTELEADYVVVGSGAAGATAACTLARHGAHVAIIEAGAWRDPNDYPSTTYGAMRDLFDDWGSSFTRGRAFWPIVQARTVGGTTVINSAISVRTPGDIFAQWEREHGLDSDHLSRAVWGYQEELEKELGVEPVPDDAAGRSNQLAWKGGRAAGYGGHVMDRYVRGCLGTGQCLQGCRAGKKQSMNLNFIPEVLRRGGDILSCAPVKKILFDKHRAVGVTGWFHHPTTRKPGGRFTVRARKAVLVAASATHSPALLERSGVKSKALGRYFRAHPGTGVFGCYDEPIDMNVGATQGWSSLAFRVDPGLKLETLALPPEMAASRLSGAGEELMERIREYRHLAMWVYACRAESAGTVRNGFGDKPVVHYTLDKRDMERFRRGMFLVAQAHFAAGAKAVIPGIYGMPYKLGPDQVGLLEQAPLDPRNYTAILSHLFGGCVMGSDPVRSVCDSRGRVHGYDGLLVVDASVIPTNLGVNPQHSIMALARHFAHQVLE